MATWDWFIDLITQTQGRWMKWLLWDVCTPRDEIPSKRALIWNTRSVIQSQDSHYWSEGESAGVAPCVEAWLMRIEIRRWFGQPLILWRVETDLQVMVKGKPCTFERCSAYADETAARAEFRAHSEEVRQGLAGTRLFPPHLEAKLRNSVPEPDYYFGDPL